ncbi:protein sidekick isoform X2 [Parasteatoda tepidariorum]|uniref:protein sidekick isoform X2 n=1 Tax=Parasteatoda tepidariorum TaxID=114398 RepID=UPI00077F9B2E|nr:protein sidekick isoform X2 [Parasteatoda tepidariorum]
MSKNCNDRWLQISSPPLCIIRNFYKQVSFKMTLLKVPFQPCDKQELCFLNSNSKCLKSPSISSSLYHSVLFHILLCVLLLLVFPHYALANQPSAPQFIVQPSFAGSIVTEKQSKILQCQAIGYPPPEFQWFKNGKPLRNFTQDPLLRLQQITKQDSGQYWCIARNDAGTIFSEKTTLTVAFMDTLTSVTNISITVKDGEAAILKSPALESIPPVSISWQKTLYGRLHGINYAVSLENDLVILAASKEDEGYYLASLTNPHAGQEATGGLVHVQVVGERRDFVPAQIIIPPKDAIFKQGVYPAALECIVNARPLDSVEIVWKKDGLDLALTGLSHLLSYWNRTVTLLNVGVIHSGIYECEVSMKESSEIKVKASANVSVIIDPVITQGPYRETVTEIGKAVLLPCSASGNPTPLITWYRNAKPITKSVGERFEVLLNGTLKISSLNGLDTGIYQCVASNLGGEFSVSTWLHVKTSAPDFIAGPSNVTVLNGKDAQISCEVSGAPAPNVTWLFNDHTDLLSSGRIQILESGSLLIASAEYDDVGKYTCVRENSAGSIKGSGYLIVLVRTQIIQPPVDTKVIISSTAELQCKVSHDEAVPYSVHWYFNNKEIIPTGGGRIQILPDGSLHIGQARNVDVGLYTCRVISEGGNETRSARLDVIELPHPPNNVKAVMLNTSPKSVNVSWSKSFDGNSPVTNYIVQMRVVPVTVDNDMEFLLPWTTVRDDISGDQRYAVLANLKPASSYEFRVSAVNGVGEGNPRAAAEIIHLPPEPPSGPPQGVVGGARSSTSIMLQWQNPAEEDRNGMLVGYVIRYKLAGYSASPWAYHNITNEAQHSFLLQDLIVWQNYEIQVAACNEKGVGAFSTSIYIRTREGVPQASPTDIRAEAVNSTAIHVWWKPPDPQLINGINQGYKLQTWLRNPESNITPSHTVLVAPSPLDPLAEQDAIVGSLEKFTTYHITVLCFTSPGDGPTSDAIVITTKQDVPNEVKTLKFEDILDTTIMVVWSPPERINGILKGYTLKYHVKDILETTVIRNLSADATRVQVTDLRPTTAYTFEIFAWTVVGPGPVKTATIQSGIPPVLPGPPTKLAVSNIGAFSVVLQFTPGFDGNTSIIKWSVEAQTRRNESWFKIYEVSDPEASNIEVKNLLPFSDYRLRLIAINVVGSSEPSHPSKFFQTIQAPPSHPPYNVTVRAVNAKALRVRWTPLQQVEWFGIPRGYNIHYRPISMDNLENSSDNNTYHHIVLEDHNANSFVLKDLEEFTDYEIAVQAFNDVGSSSLSIPARERTREAVPSSGPTDVKINATSSTTIVVKWGEVPKIHQNGIIEGYKVYYGAKNVPFQYKTIESNNTFTTTLTELRKYTQYSVQVLAFTRIGDGVLSIPPMSVRTFEDVPGVPSNISFPDVSTTTARILWDVPEEPNGEILAYRVSYRLYNSNEEEIVKELAPTERTLKVLNLQPDTYYMFSLTAKSNEGWGKTAHVKVFTTNNREAPQPPSIPQISNSQIQARQITFSWTPGRDGFAPLRFNTVQMTKSDNSWKTVAAKVDPTLNKYTVTGLKPFTPYKFRIQATNDIGSSGWSQESNLTWTFPAAPEQSPKHVMATPYTTTSVRVSWEALGFEDWNGDVRTAGYRVEYCQVSAYSIPRTGDCPAGKIQGVNSSVLALHQLERDRVYEIRVYAFNSRGESPSSLPVQVFVGEAVPTGEPREVTIESISSTELKVSWKPPPPSLQNGDLLGYKIFYEPANNEGFEEMEAVPPATVSYVLLDLKKYTEYNIQILAFNPAGDGPRSPPQYISTMEDIPGPPGPLIFIDVTMTSLKVSWNPPSEPNGVIAGYLVTYETALPDIDFSKQVKQKVTSTSLSVHGLAEAVTYTFRVRAETFDYGPESVGNITTGPQGGSPSAPEELILKHSHSSLTLTWKNGPQGASPIIGYLIEYKESDNTDEWQTLILLNNGPQSSYTVSFRNLLPSTSYQFRLFARNSYGISFPAMSPTPFATPSKLYHEYRQKQLPFYREVWFLVMIASLSVIVIVLVVAVLCVKSKVYKYKKEAQKSIHDDHMSMDDGGFPTFELRQSKRGTLCKNSLSRKNHNAMLTKCPPRPSPGSVTYSDDDDTKGYDENCDSSSLTEKPSEMSSSDSQGSDSDAESNGKADPHSFVNHYANVNDTLRQSWKRQRPVKPPSYTDSEPEGSIQVSLNGGHIVMNNMAGSRAPLPGFSSFV